MSLALLKDYPFICAIIKKCRIKIDDGDFCTWYDSCVQASDRIEDLLEYPKPLFRNFNGMNTLAEYEYCRQQLELFKVELAYNQALYFIFRKEYVEAAKILTRIPAASMDGNIWFQMFFCAFMFDMKDPYLQLFNNFKSLSIPFFSSGESATENETGDFLHPLPMEIKTKVVNSLDLSDLFNCMLVSKTWKTGISKLMLSYPYKSSIVGDSIRRTILGSFSAKSNLSDTYISNFEFDKFSIENDLGNLTLLLITTRCNVRRLTINYDMYIPFLISLASETNSSLFRNVKDLKLSTVNFHSYVKTLEHFTGLEILEIPSNISYIDGFLEFGDDVPIEIQGLSKLKKVKFKVLGPEITMDGILKFDSVKYFQIEVGSEEQVYKHMWVDVPNLEVLDIFALAKTVISWDFVLKYTNLKQFCLYCDHYVSVTDVKEDFNGPLDLVVIRGYLKTEGEILLFNKVKTLVLKDSKLNFVVNDVENLHFDSGPENKLNLCQVFAAFPNLKYLYTNSCTGADKLSRRLSASGNAIYLENMCLRYTRSVQSDLEFDTFLGLIFERKIIIKKLELNATVFTSLGEKTIKKLQDMDITLTFLNTDRVFQLHPTLKSLSWKSHLEALPCIS